MQKVSKDTKIQLRSLCISAHLDSLCLEVYKVCGNDFEFVYTDPDPGAVRRKFGWRTDADYPSMLDDDVSFARAETCDMLVEMLRELSLMERRAKQGRKTIYVSERWFKPINLFGSRHCVSGFLRMLHPGYFKTARRFVRLMERDSFWVFPTGIVAARDFARLYGLFHGDWRCLFRAPRLTFERFAGGRISSARKCGLSMYGLERMRMWCYFVASSEKISAARDPSRVRSKLMPPKRILWCGGMMRCKRVDVLIRAWRHIRRMHDDIALQIVGEGEMDALLRQLSKPYAENGLAWIPGKVTFAPYQHQERVRELMREADVYVMPSDGCEGWGAAVSDALTEGCPVLSTYEAGSSATLLPETHLFHAGSVPELEALLSRPVSPIGYEIHAWDAQKGAAFLKELLGGEIRG